MTIDHTLDQSRHRTHHTRRARRAMVAGLLACAVVGASALPAAADDRGRGHVAVSQTNLVANRDGFGASIVDPSLVNAWGMSKFPTSPVWVSDNGTGLTTLYTGGGAAAPTGVTKVALTVSIAGAPTGQVANNSTGFALAGGSVTRFIFATEQGQIFAWGPSAGTTAQLAATVPNGDFKGLAQVANGTNPWLLAADFTNGSIDVWDSAWNPVTMPGAFTVPFLPRGFAPFNVQTLRDANGADHVFVAYAKRDPKTNDEVDGHGLGLIAEFTPMGRLVHLMWSPALNAPWGLAYAPSTWGRAAGDLLVGQFGSGKIVMFDARGHDQGLVRDANNRTLVIDGLWALMPGDATAGGAGSMLFTAGPNDEADGLYGVLSFLPAVQHGD